MANSRCIDPSLVEILDVSGGDHAGTYTLASDNALHLDGSAALHLITVENLQASGVTYTIKFRDELTIIKRSAFENCSGLTSVEFGPSLELLDNNAFKNTGLTSVVIPDSVTTIDNEAFRNCANLVSLTIGNGVTSIGQSAFANCRGITSIIIPNSVTSIVGAAFRDCRGITSITIPDSVTSIGNSAFERCTLLESVILGNNITTISDYTFKDCSSLTSIEFGPSLESIGIEAFSRCFSLTSFTIPDSVTSIGNSIFETCISLTSVIIPDSITTIEVDMFRDCRSLESITIPDSVTSINSGAFYDCKSLTSITMGISLEIIQGSAFRQCTALTSVTIPNNVTSIGDNAFLDCTSLESLTLGKNVTTIEQDAFKNTGLTSYNCILPDNTTRNVTSESPNFDNMPIIFGNVITYNITGSLIIPDGVEIIGKNAFKNSSLTSIEFPDSVKSIQDGAFVKCNNLLSLTIGNGVTSIGQSAFIQSGNLKSVEFGPSLESIGDYAFKFCGKLGTILKIPDSVISIGQEAFANCGVFERVIFGKSIKNLGNAIFQTTTVRSLLFNFNKPYKEDGTEATQNYSTIVFNIPQINGNGENIPYPSATFENPFPARPFKNIGGAPIVAEYLSLTKKITDVKDELGLVIDTETIEAGIDAIEITGVEPSIGEKITVPTELKTLLTDLKTAGKDKEIREIRKSLITNLFAKSRRSEIIIEKEALGLSESVTDDKIIVRKGVSKVIKTTDKPSDAGLYVDFDVSETLTVEYYELDGSLTVLDGTLSITKDSLDASGISTFTITDTGSLSLDGTYKTDDVLNLHDTTLILGSVTLTSGSGSSSGDPHVYPIVGKMYELPIKEATYRMVDGNNLIVNASTRNMTKNEGEAIKKYYERQTGKKCPEDLMTSGVFYNKVYLESEGEKMEFNFDTKEGKCTSDYFKLSKKVYKNKKVSKYEVSELMSEVNVSFKHSKYGKVVLSLRKFSNPQIENGIGLKMTKYGDVRGLLIREYETRSMEVSNIRSKEEVSGVLGKNKVQSKMLIHKN